MTEQQEPVVEQGAQRPSVETFPADGEVEFDTEVEAPVAGATTPEGDQVAELTDQLKRVQAEYVNYKRRVDRDRELVQQNARYAVLSSLLPVLDAIDRARLHGELDSEGNAGFKAVAESLEKVVESQGLTKFGARGDEFDPTVHEAVMHGHSPEATSTTVQDIVSAGYRMGERVVRPATVTVVGPQE